MNKDVLKHFKIDRINHDASADEDDCAICRATAEAEKRGYELSEEELLALFEKQNAENALKGQMPEMIITYRCEGCGETVMIVDDQKNESGCIICKSGDYLKELRRDPITSQLMGVSMSNTANLMVKSLQKAYEQRTQEGFDKGEEEELLETLAKAKEARDTILKMAEDFDSEQKNT